VKSDGYPSPTRKGMGMNGTRMRTFGGYLAAITVGVLVPFTALSGTAYAPPQTKPVNIADLQEPSNVADVSANGALEVEGTVTGQVDVGNLPAVQEVTSQDDPGRMSYSRRVHYHSLEPATFVVPPRMRLVITYVSGSFVNPVGNGKGDDFHLVRLQAGADAGGVRHAFVPTFTGTASSSNPPPDHYVFAEHTQIYAEGEFEVFPIGPGNLNPVVGYVSVSGYLIDCPRGGPNCN